MIFLLETVCSMDSLVNTGKVPSPVLCKLPEAERIVTLPRERMRYRVQGMSYLFLTFTVQLFMYRDATIIGHSQSTSVQCTPSVTHERQYSFLIHVSRRDKVQFFTHRTMLIIWTKNLSKTTSLPIGLFLLYGHQHHLTVATQRTQTRTLSTS